jgi:hypothetical protein
MVLPAVPVGVLVEMDVCDGVAVGSALLNSRETVAVVADCRTLK